MPGREFKIRKILVATDFSEHAAAALGRAVWLAEHNEAEIVVQHVIEDVTSAVPGASFAFHWTIADADLRKAEKKLRVEATERLRLWVEPFQQSASRLRTEIRVGVPFIETIRGAVQKKADLVIAGTRGLSPTQRLLVGSTAERMIRKCPCPVWIVKPEHEWPMRSILVPVDLTKVSEKSLRIAGLFARLSGCSITVLYVLNFPRVHADIEPSLSIGQQRYETRRMAAGHLADFVARFGPAGVPVHQQMGTGQPWRLIGTVARRIDAGLIVMGSVGRTGIPGFLIGNTAEKVLRNSDRSILTLKPDGFVSPVQV